MSSLAQRRQSHRHHVQTIEKVLAEEPLADVLAEVPVGGRDDTHVGADRGASTDGRVFAFLKHAQEARLGLERHVADLVEEERAVIGLLEAPGVARIGAGEGPLLMTEELALDQLARDCRHVDGDERSGAALAVIVKRPRDELLAGARLARDRDGEVRAHEAREHAVDLLHRGRAADERQLLLGVRRQLALLVRRAAGERALDHADELAQVEGFGQILEGAALGRPHGGHEIVLRAHDDDAQIGADLLDARDEVEAVLIRHQHVGDHEVALAVGDPAPQRGRVPRRAHGISRAAERLVEHGPDGAIVVGHENGRGAHNGSPRSASPAALAKR